MPATCRLLADGVTAGWSFWPLPFNPGSRMAKTIEPDDRAAVTNHWSVGWCASVRPRGLRV